MDYSRGDRSLEQLVELLTDPENWSSDFEPIVLHCPGKHPVLVTVMGLEGGRNGYSRGRVFLSVAPIGHHTRPDPSLLTHVFGLTAAEARLASALAAGLSLDAAAAELKVARETVRSQLKPVFAKTGTHRQSELVALLARL